MVDEKQVEEFISENRPLIEDPNTGKSACERAYLTSLNMHKELLNQSERAANEATTAARKLTDAIKDPNCPASKVDMKEREYNVLREEHKRLLELSERFGQFVREAGEAYTKRTGQKEDKPWPKYPLFDSGEPDFADNVEEEQVSRPRQQAPYWVGLVALGMVCLTILAVVYLLLTYWG